MTEKISTIPTQHERNYNPEDEKRLEEVHAQLERLRIFVHENPNSPKLTEIAAVLRATLGESAPQETAAPEVETEPAVIEAPVEPAEIGTPVVDDVEPEVKEAEKVPQLKTFEQARSEADPLSDDFIDDALANKLQKPGGEKAFGVKGYLDNVPADASDKEFLASHDQVIELREQLTDFVAKELRITAPPEYEAHLVDKRRQFTEKLEAGKEAFRNYVKGRENRLDLRDNPAPINVLDFYGFTVESTDGRKADLLEDKVPGIYSNIYIQREIAGRFVHWSSEGYARQRVAGDRPVLTRRIYLNPRPQESVRIFTDVIHAADKLGLAVKGKIYDRVNDSDVMKAYDSVGEEYSVRGDGIVLYASEAEAEQLLAAVAGVYQNHADAFEQRGLSSIPFEIAPGIGLGDEPELAGASLTSHRAAVIEEVVADVRASGESDPARQRELFRRLWREAAVKENINPDNPAFNNA